MGSIGYGVAGRWASDATEVGSLVAGELATAAQRTQNRLNFQAILDQGGDLKITTPGIYSFDVVAGPLTLPSNTSLYVGAGVTLKVADGSPSALFTNSAARSAGVPVLAANSAYAAAPANGWANNSAIHITNMTAANAALFPVGSMVSVVVLGHGALGAQGTAWNNRGYRGVWRVIEQTINGGSSSIKYLIDNVYPGGAAAANNLVLYPANENIKIWGPGIIDGNGSLADQSFNTGDPRGCLMWWRHGYNITVEGLHFLRGVTFTIGSNYVRNYTVRSVTFELHYPPTFTTIDFVHLSGNHQNVLIEDIDGGSGDNTIGFTIDCTDAAAALPAGLIYNFPYQHPGDMYDITIRRVSSNAISEDGAIAIIGIYGPAAYKYNNIVINQVAGNGSAAIQLANYATTGQNKLTIDRIAVSNVRAFCGGAQLEFTALSIHDIGELTLDGILSPREDVVAIYISDTATGNIRSLTLRNIATMPYDGVTFTRAATLGRLGGININALNIMGCEGIVMGANLKAFDAAGPGNIPKIGIQNCSATGTGTAHLWGDTGAGTAAAPVYNNSTYNGTPL